MDDDRCDTKDKSQSWSDYVYDFLSIWTDFPWIKKASQVWGIINKWIHNHPNIGMYEVKEYESTLELKDTKGKLAFVSKNEKVAYLQDHIIAYQDQAWGDGKILQGYRCSPGYPVDFYRLGHKTQILISLRDVRNKGDSDVFKIQWKMKNGFLLKNGFWATEINHNTRRLKVNIIFPMNRPPRNVLLVEQDKQRSIELGNTAISQLPDERWLVYWEKSQPHLFESYILKWEW